MHCYAFKPQLSSSIIHNLPVCPSERRARSAGLSAVSAQAAVKQADLHELPLPPLPGVRLGPQNASGGPSTIYYFLTDAQYFGEDLPEPLGHNLSSLSEKKIFGLAEFLATGWKDRVNALVVFSRLILLLLTLCNMNATIAVA